MSSEPSIAVQALAARIDAALPQTQCTRCGYPDCASYALAMAQGAAALNQCPPGGAEGIERLAAITGRPVLPLNEEHGIEGPVTVAVIDEQWCIGCTLCMKACPTDAILGANKHMHTVMADHCTGCELCIPVCPVDCIDLINVTGEGSGWMAQANHAKTRYTARQIRVSADPKDAKNQIGRFGRLGMEVAAQWQQDDAPLPPLAPARSVDVELTLAGLPDAENVAGAESGAENLPASTASTAANVAEQQTSSHAIDPKKAAIAAAMEKARQRRLNAGH